MNYTTPKQPEELIKSIEAAAVKINNVKVIQDDNGDYDMHVTATITDTSHIPSSLEEEITIERPSLDNNMQEDYDRSQCIYGPDSKMLCAICSQLCPERVKDLKKAGIKVECIPAEKKDSDNG